MEQRNKFYDALEAIRINVMNKSSWCRQAQISFPHICVLIYLITKFSKQNVKYQYRSIILEFIIFQGSIAHKIFHKCSFLLSGHILCKESIVIAKKFDFEIFTYLYVFRSPEFIYAIFTVIYVCVCAFVSEHDSV